MTVDQPKAPDLTPTTDIFSEVLEAASLENAFAGVTTLRGAVGVEPASARSGAPLPPDAIPIRTRSPQAHHPLIPS